MTTQEFFSSRKIQNLCQRYCYPQGLLPNQSATNAQQFLKRKSLDPLAHDKQAPLVRFEIEQLQEIRVTSCLDPLDLAPEEFELCGVIFQRQGQLSECDDSIGL